MVVRSKEEFLTNPDATSYPWLDSPFAGLLIDRADLTPKEKDLCHKYARDGYLIVDLDLSPDFIQGLKDDMFRMREEEDRNYFYNPDPEHRRFFKFWQKSRHAQALAANEKVLNILKLLYRRNPFPFQTINFIDPTEQLPHSDTIHFHSIPQHWVAAVWVALEPMSRENGTLRFYPGSHKMPVFEFNDLAMDAPVYDGQQVGANAQDAYQTYEQFILALIEAQGLSEEYFITDKPGTALIWAANLLHGGSSLVDKSRTRISQVTHYYFEGCSRYYCPMFSNTHRGHYSDKNLDTHNILGHKFDEDS